MVRHITMWNLKPFAAGNDKETNYKIIKERSIELAKEFGKMESIEFGRGYKSGGQFYDMAQILTFRTKEDLEEFLAFPAHKTMHAFAVEVRAERAACDYEIDETIQIEEQKRESR